MRYILSFIAIVILVTGCTWGTSNAAQDNAKQGRPPRRTAGAGGTQEPRKDGKKPPRDQQAKGGQSKYSLEQAISDKAQLNTIAFDGLAFLTGDFGSCTFIPPGKVADYFGFQYMRDIDAGELGHNTSFLTRIANAMLSVLTEEQKAQLVALGNEQAPQFEKLARQRFPLIEAFCRQAAGELPQGSPGLSRDAVVKYSAAMWELDGELAYRRAVVCGAILHSLSAKQKAALAGIKFGDSRTWPDLPDQIDKRSMPHATHVAVMTYASEMFSWYAGSLEADVYFCPERHGTYFGSFYMKDMPAMGNPNYSISTSLTGESGERFIELLNDGQRGQVTGLVELQRKDLSEIVTVRRAIATELRMALGGGTVDKAKVLKLSRRYGELDGEISYFYASHFAAVGTTLSQAQRQQLKELRNLDDYPSRGAFLYSEPIELPELGSTDFLFGAAGARK
jgi:hypothetical protein